MFVVIAGGHGKIARRLARLLVARGDRVRGLVRNPDHVADLEADGTDPLVCDLESAAVDEIASAIEAADAVVFAAGAGHGSGAERKGSMDRDGAIKLVEVARASGVERYLIVSSVGAENPPAGDDVSSVYLRAKAEADEAVVASDRAWTVVRPGYLSDMPGEGRVRIHTEPFLTEVTRDDVAALLAALLHEPRSAHHVLYVGNGEDPIDMALATVVAA